MSKQPQTYAGRRDFAHTPEPAAGMRENLDPGKAKGGGKFVIHQHHARRLHFDLRLEMRNSEGPVLVSWAVPKNLPRKKKERHLAIRVEDHPFAYGNFEGTIPEGEYGAGEVRIFDQGSYELLEQEEGKLTFRLRGERMRGIWHLIRPRGMDENNWLVMLREWEGPEPEELPPLSPMLAALAQEPFSDPGWSFEVKWDGLRSLVVLAEGTLLFSRNQREITHVYPELGRLHERVVALEGVLDGEIIALDEEGKPSFQLLQRRINLESPRDITRAARETPVSYVAFDLLYLDGVRMIHKPLEERRRLLEKILVPSESLIFSRAERGEGSAMFEAVRKQGLEGIVAKRLGSPYRPGARSRDWLKIKSTRDADVVIAGFTPGQGARKASFGALLLGAYDDRGLRYLGAVGTGFDDATLSHLTTELNKLTSERCPFTETPSELRSGKLGKPVWVHPLLVARVRYRQLTEQSRLRAPSFQGVRADKRPEECRFEELKR